MCDSSGVHDGGRRRQVAVVVAPDTAEAGTGTAQSVDDGTVGSIIPMKYKADVRMVNSNAL